MGCKGGTRKSERGRADLLRARILAAGCGAPSAAEKNKFGGVARHKSNTQGSELHQAPSGLAQTASTHPLESSD